MNRMKKLVQQLSVSSFYNISLYFYVFTIQQCSQQSTSTVIGKLKDIIFRFLEKDKTLVATVDLSKTNSMSW